MSGDRASSSAVALRSPSPRSRTPRETLATGLVVGGKATRTIEISNEGGTECITIGASTTAKVTEVAELVGGFLNVDPGSIRFTMKQGAFVRNLKFTDEVGSHITAVGIKSFKRATAKYKHPIAVIGGGLGGIQTMIHMQRNGRTDFVCFEKLEDFGGHSWMVVANKFTKLQTEKGTYHVDYILPEAEVPKGFGDVEYKTWPSRDELLVMFREQAGQHGLYEKTHFGVSVEKVKVFPGSGNYGLATVPVDGDDNGELVMASAVSAWPGNLCDYRLIDFPGEEEFGGYIEYSSFCKVDYSQVERRDVILYGHGAFTIENVRTLLEHRAKKVFVLCRKRNLCGMKVASWLVGLSEVPVPGTIVLEIFQKMYDLLGFDAWSAHSVRTDAARSFCHVSQKTVFGVTDIYFLAGYYGLMEVVVDEIKRLSHRCAHTVKGRKIECDVVLKAVGTLPSFKIDKMLGIKELVGLWTNGDPLRPVGCNGMFVEARNFGSFSSGPGFVGVVAAHTWFFDYPSDFEVVRGAMPRQRASDRPAYVPSATHMLPTMSSLQNMLPMLGAQIAALDAMKHTKQRKTHPMHQFLAECRAEWQMYIRQFKDAGMIALDDRPDPPYPYSEAEVQDWLDRAAMYWMRRGGAA